MPLIFLNSKKALQYHFLYRSATVFLASFGVFTSGLVAAQANVGSVSGTPISIRSTVGLSFGSFVANTGGDITITSAGGRSKSGSLVLIAQGASSSAAIFTITGLAGAWFSIMLPADGVIALSHGIDTMAVTTFQSNLADSEQLVNGNQTLRVGARLVVGNAQAAGSYTGTFPITVNYQ
ncbi:hypothetical protein A0E43_19225 [Pectobacterium cacticida]|uniref:DUF4402 domain-containing protein n=1 Tax=Polaromonas sp. E5S TaxID=1840267 RepID=A0A2S1FI53_9BURK|nr:DUF4402 domain-containing protein [Polaromonas sp. E5S]AWD72170.1 hypothetical protein pE5SP1_p054 [Polaromonas sp. E5S]